MQRDRDEDGAFGVEPVARPGRGRQLGGRRADRLEARPVLPFGRDEDVHGAGGDAQVVVEQAGHRGQLAARAVFGRGELTGVGAQQVVQAVPAGPDRVDEVRAGEQGERVLGLGGGDGGACAVGGAAGQRGDGVGVEIGTRVQADQPERPRGGGRQVPVGPGEHAADRGPLVAARVEQVKPPLLPRQLPRQFGQAAVRARGGQLGRHPQRQRQPRALGRQLGRRVGLGVDPVADQRPQQPDRVGGGQHVEREPPRPVPRDQPGQRVAAGHHHQAGRAAGQQRAGLLDAGGVVEHAPASGGRRAGCGRRPRARLPRPGCPLRPGRALAGTRPGRRPGRPARPDRSRAGSRRAGRRGTRPPPGAPSGPRARSCPPRRFPPAP